MYFISCEKETEPVTKNPDVQLSTLKVNNGILEFNSADEYFKSEAQILNLPENELDKWEKQIGFESMRSVINNAYDELDLVELEEDFYNVMDKYRDVLTIQDSVVRPIVEDIFLQSITSREGLYSSVSHFNKVLPDGVVSINKQHDIKVLKSVTNLNDANSNHELIVYKPDYEASRLKSTGCGASSIEASATKNASKCKDRRRVFVSMVTAKRKYSYSNGEYAERYSVWVQVTAERMLGVVCLWKRYDTFLEFKNVNYKIRAPYYFPDFQWMTYTDATNWWGRSDGDAYTLTRIKNTGDLIYNVTLPTPTFISVHAEASSRGVGDLWAVVDCD